MLYLGFHDLFVHFHPITFWGSLPIHATSLVLLPCETLWIFEGSCSANQRLPIFLKNFLRTILAACFPIQLGNKSYISSFAVSFTLVPSFFVFQHLYLYFCENSLPLPRHDQTVEILGNITLGSILWLSFGECGNKTMCIITTNHSGARFNMTFSCSFTCNLQKRLGLTLVDTEKCYTSSKSNSDNSRQSKCPL